MSVVSALLSVVVATDSFATVERVVDVLCRQTIADRIELVLVTPAPDEVDAAAAAAGAALAAVRVVQIDDLVPLSAARARGVAAATADVVFLGETHSYPQERFAEELLEAHRGDWVAVVPGFENGNPEGALSWAAFLADYGAWSAELEPRELEHIPSYNTAYKRSALLELGPLEDLLTPGDELIVRLRERGARFRFHPAARILHVNVATPRFWLQERYLGGLTIASSRSRHWTRGRRLLYALGSPLIPLVTMARIVPGVRAARGQHAVPLATYPALALTAVASGVGELAAYLGGPVDRGERRMTEYEIHRFRYVRE